MKKTTRHHIIIALMLLAAVIAMALSLPRQSGVPEYSYEVGKPWINPTLTAMFDVPIEYDSETTKRITDSVKSDFIPIFDREEKTGQRQVALLAKALDSTPGISGNKQALLSMLPCDKRLLLAFVWQSDRLSPTEEVESRVKNLLRRMAELL